MQTMAATKRNAGLASAVPRATLNDEDLVCRIHHNSPQSCTKPITQTRELKFTKTIEHIYIYIHIQRTHIHSHTVFDRKCFRCFIKPGLPDSDYDKYKIKFLLTSPISISVLYINRMNNMLAVIILFGIIQFIEFLHTFSCLALDHQRAFRYFLIQWQNIWIPLSIRLVGLTTTKNAQRQSNPAGMCITISVVRHFQFS